MGLFSSLYERTLRWSAHPHAERYLAGVSFAESSFFPIPPDVLLAPMTLAQPARWWRFALLTTVASVLGGLAGYLIGRLALEAVGSRIDMSKEESDCFVRCRRTVDRLKCRRQAFIGEISLTDGNPVGQPCQRRRPTVLVCRAAAAPSEPHRPVRSSREGAGLGRRAWPLPQCRAITRRLDGCCRASGSTDGSAGDLDVRRLYRRERAGDDSARRAAR